MRATLRNAVTGVLGLCLLSVPVLRLAYLRSRASSPPGATFLMPLPPRSTPADRALREAQEWRLQAMWVADQEREAQEACDPDPITSVDREAERRRRLIARDRCGYLGRARSAAQQAAALARTPAETYRAAALLARLECYTGHHQEELRQARRLVTLAPWNPRSWMALRRAARCNGLGTLARRADAQMSALAEPVVIRYPDPSLRRDGLQVYRPRPPYDELEPDSP
jgi:hypothetical protein